MRRCLHNKCSRVCETDLCALPVPLPPPLFSSNLTRNDNVNKVVLFELLHNGQDLITQQSRRHVASGCSAPQHGTDDIVCGVDAGVTLEAGDTLTPTWFDIRTSASAAETPGGTLTLDLWALVAPADAQATASLAASTASSEVETEPRWVLLLSDAGYSGAGPNDVGYLAQLPPGDGTFKVTRVRAVHRSGHVSCDLNATLDVDNVWEACAGDAYGAAGQGGAFPTSFELKHNGAYVLEAPSAFDPPSSCTQNPRTAGVASADYVCDVDFEVAAGDRLAPEAFEAGHPESGYHSNNTGTHYVDVWALLTPVAPASWQVAASPIHAPGDMCTVACDAGLSRVGAAIFTCGSDGVWRAEAPDAATSAADGVGSWVPAAGTVASQQPTRCLATAAFESAAPAQRPWLHSWSFDSAVTAGRTLSDDGLEGSALFQQDGVLEYTGNGATVLDGADSDIGCAVGKCLRVSACGSGMRTAAPFNATALGGNRPKSIAAWVRLPPTLGLGNAGATPVPILSLGTDGCGAAFGLVVDRSIEGGGLLGRIHGASCGVDNLVAGVDASLGSTRWRHVALTHDGSSTTLYLDGQAVASRSGALATQGSDGDARVVIGGDGGGANAAEVACDVGVDEVRVYAYALSTSQVVQLHTAALRCPALSPPAFGSMECSGLLPGDACRFTCSDAAASAESVAAAGAGVVHEPQGRQPTSSSRTCQSDGTWSGSSVACVRLTPQEVADASRRPQHHWTFDDTTVSASDAVTRDVSDSAATRVVAEVTPGPLVGFRGVGTDAVMLLASDTVQATDAGAVRAMRTNSKVSGGNAGLHLTVDACTSDGAFVRSLARANGADASDPSLVGAGARSLAMWVNVASLIGDGSGNLPLASLGGSRSAAHADCTAAGSADHCDGGRLAIRYESGLGAVAASTSGAGNEVAHATDLTTGRWTHVAAVYDDATSDLALYVDGRLSQTQASVALDTGEWATELVRLGRDSLYSTASTVACNVAIDDVRIYDVALSSDEVLAIASMSAEGKIALLL